MVTHNKLVRDKIPQIIRNDGKSCSVRVLDHLEMKDALGAKLREEIDEYLEKNDESSIKRPDHCGLYILVPHSVEFWLERDNRTHERRKYFLDENGWNSCLLSP